MIRVISVCLVTLFCAASAFARPTEIKLGGLFDFTSADGSVWGTTERDGFLLAIEDFQQQHPEVAVSYILEDSAYSNTQSVSGIQKLISVNGIKYVVGPTWETFTATSPICELNKVIRFAPSNHGVMFHDKRNKLQYSFTAFFEEKGYGTTIAEEIIKDGKKKVALVSGITTYYEVLNSAVKETLPFPLSFFEEVNLEQKDFRSIINRIPRDLDAVVLLVDGGGQSQVFLNQWMQLRKDRPKIYSHDGILYEPKWESIKKYGFEFAVSVPAVDAALDSKWSEKFVKRFGHVPGAPSGSIAYDETMLILKCIVSVGEDTSKVRECIANTENYVGYSGTLSFGGEQSCKTRHFEIQTFVSPK